MFVLFSLKTMSFTEVNSTIYKIFIVTFPYMTSISLEFLLQFTRNNTIILEIKVTVEKWDFLKKKLEFSIINS